MYWFPSMCFYYFFPREPHIHIIKAYLEKKKNNIIFRLNCIHIYFSFLQYKNEKIFYQVYQYKTKKIHCRCQWAICSSNTNNVDVNNYTRLQVQSSPDTALRWNLLFVMSFSVFNYLCFYTSLAFQYSAFSVPDEGKSRKAQKRKLIACCFHFFNRITWRCKFLIYNTCQMYLTEKNFSLIM